MGKNQSKPLSSFFSALGLAGDERTARHQGPLPHSNSLGSISTAVSFNSDQHLSHSNSMDHLLQSSKPTSSTAGKYRGQSSFLKRKDNGKVYDALVETSSIVTAFSDAVLKNAGAVEGPPLANFPDAGTEGSGEDPLSNGCGEEGKFLGLGDIHSGKRRGEFDSVSNKFILECDTSEEEQKQLLEDTAGDSEAAGEGHFHPAIIKKLSHKEWEELISYAYTTLGRTQLASILKKIHKSQPRHHDHQSERISMETIEGGIQHTDNHKTGLTGSANKIGINGICVEDLLLRLCELQSVDTTSRTSDKEHPKLERTVSLPPLNQHQLSSRQRPANTHLASEEAGKQQDCNHHPRSRSHGESDYRQRQPSRYRKTRKEHKSDRGKEGDRYHGVSRKKKVRSRSDGRQDLGSTRVDPSLDDDCPGVFENRVVRRTRQSVCKQCGVDRRGRGEEKAGSAGTRKEWGENHRASPPRGNGDCPVADHVTRSPKGASSDLVGVVPSSWSTKGASSEKPTVVMTLEDVQKAALLFENSTEFVESGEDDAVGAAGEESHASQVYPQDVDNVSESAMAEADFCWRDTTQHTISTPRSGRDSPHTDMAVACLDMNSDRMLRPSDTSRSLEWSILVGGRGESYHQHIHLHSHHHYHHVIHHHSQP